MRSFLFFFIVTVLTFLNSLYAQEIEGKWNGVLTVQKTQLKVVFNVSKTADGFTTTMDSPDQGANGIPVTQTTFKNSLVKFEVTNARIEYTGELKGKEIIGTFKQGGQEFPLNLSKKALEKVEIAKTQDPKKPYPYHTEEVTFPNSKASISLAGTLSLPKQEGIYPAVILITGSGPQKRDEDILGHKPFLVISDYLTRNGFAVLRFDDRGVGQSTGDFSSATSQDFATDVESALTYLKTRKEIDKKAIGLIGHSEGGLIAPMVATQSKDIRFIVLLAGPGISGDQLLLLQQRALAKAAGFSESDMKKTFELNSKIFEMVVQSKNEEKLQADVRQFIDAATTEIPNGVTKEEYVAMQCNKILNPWMKYFLKYNPALTLEKVQCSVLAVNGENDLQVPAKENLIAISNALKKGGNKDFITKEFPNMNHLFQESTTGLPSEYATIEQTFSPIALEYITQWMRAKIK
ncbi:alpha/beta hydrolase family protein [Flavobacterium sp. TMP13]|uniref:alpha/beta hydrolase family protein n=1 Tax=Flavobacterium sp. TMP13 TaxID=3425950 RepID=UPI003D78AB84